MANTEWQAVSPAGARPIADITPMAPRLGTLDGKTVGLVWNGTFRGDVTFPVIGELLQRKYPGITVIPHTEFPTPTSYSMQASMKSDMLDAVRAALMAKKCDAVITGNGG